jgi:glycosyltransferase involved in cell wall biosynthesis
LGHKVTVITCAPNVPSGIVYEGYENRPYQREIVDGIEVLRVWTYIAANKGTLKRILNYVSYTLTSVLASVPIQRPDIIIATSPQFFCGWSGVLANLWRGVPFVLEIRDIWPDSITAVGAMEESPILKAVYVLEKWMYESAWHIVTVGNGYRRELLKKGVPNEKMTVITNGVYPERYKPRAPNLDFKASLGITEPFVCSYVGTIGMACGLNVVLEAAQALQQQGREDIALVLVGDGAQRQELEERAKQRQLKHVYFTGRLDKKRMPDVLSISDVSLVHLRKTDLFQTVLPSNIFEAAAMERPIILGVQGDSADIIKAANAGICIEPENATELTEALLTLKDQPETRQQLGENGRQYVEQHFDRRHLADTYLSLLEQLTKQGATPQRQNSAHKR